MTDRTPPNRPQSHDAATERPLFDRIYDVLVGVCGATDDESNRLQWDRFWNDSHRHNVEYRFIGNLGFGGKFWRANGGWYVNCYPEDSTPEREAIIAVANVELEQLRQVWNDDAVGVLEA